MKKNILIIGISVILIFFFIFCMNLELKLKQDKKLIQELNEKKIVVYVNGETWYCSEIEILPDYEDQELWECVLFNADLQKDMSNGVPIEKLHFEMLPIEINSHNTNIKICPKDYWNK